MTTTFDALGVSSELVDALATQGITEPFAIQSLTIADALAGHDVLGKAKTGLGQDPGLRPPAPRPDHQGRAAPPARAGARADP